MTSTSSLTTLQHQVLKILLADSNEKQPITGMNLIKRIGLNSFGKKNAAIDMRSIIHVLRIKGFPICANSRGYFYAKTQEALSKFILKLQARVISQEEALNGLKQSFHNVGGVIADKSEVAWTVKKPIRTEHGTVAYMDFKIGADGQPIIPEGVKLV